MSRSRVSLCVSGRIPIKSERRKRKTAITSCVQRKKSGVDVLKSTHLLLQITCSVMILCQGLIAYTMTIYVEIVVSFIYYGVDRGHTAKAATR
jgi:hypothetical protein